MSRARGVGRVGLDVPGGWGGVGRGRGRKPHDYPRECVRRTEVLASILQHLEAEPGFSATTAELRREIGVAQIQLPRCRPWPIRPMIAACPDPCCFVLAQRARGGPAERAATAGHDASARPAQPK